MEGVLVEACLRHPAGFREEMYREGGEEKGKDRQTDTRQTSRQTKDESSARSSRRQQSGIVGEEAFAVRRRTMNYLAAKAFPHVLHFLSFLLTHFHTQLIELLSSLFSRLTATKLKAG